jgi:site-specific recombinase XerD
MSKKLPKGLTLRGNIYWCSVAVNGQVIRKSTGTSDLRTALAIYAKIRTLITEDKWFDRERQQKYTLQMLIDKTLKEHTSISPASRKMYEIACNHFITFFGHTALLSAITPARICEYIEWRKAAEVKPATRNREMAVLSKMFNLSRRWGWLDNNPCSLVSREREDNADTGKCLTVAHEQAILAVAHPYLHGQLRDMIIVAVNSGLREGELLSLKWADVDLQRYCLSVRNYKAHRTKITPINATVRDVLLRRSQQIKSISGFVFHSSNHTKIEGRNLRRAWYLAQIRAAIDERYRWQDLRHTCATRLAQAGTDIYSIAKILDHSQLSTTQRYAKHSIDSLLKHVAKLDNFGQNYAVNYS